MVNIQTLSLPGFDPLDFFSKLRLSEKKPAYFTSGEWTVIAWNPKKTVQSKNSRIFAALQKANTKRCRRYKGSLPFIGGLIGYLNYEVQTEGGCFYEYDQALLWNGKKLVAVGDKKFTKEVLTIHQRSTLSQRRIVSSAAVMTEKAKTAEDMDLPLRWQPSITYAQYSQAFKKIQKDIQSGEYYQLNLTYTLETQSACDRRLLFCALARGNPAACASYFESGNLAILSLSPERFVTIENGTITTCPIKGTRPRGKDAKEDLQCRNELLKSEKEEAELNMITDLLRNDIGKVSKTGSVKVLAHRKLQKNPTVWHTYSVIQGKIVPVLHPVQALESMCPGGSVTGCPKQVTIERISELEKRKRGPYCGSMVMLSDNGFLDSTMLIRTIVARGKHLSLGIGGGIVADSVLEDEWQETQQKAKAFLPPPLDPSNPDSYGVFETMRVGDGTVCDLEAHVKRLQKSAQIIGMKLPKNIPDIQDLLRSAVRKTHEPFVRLKVVCTPSDVIVEIHPLIIYPRDRTGISATFINVERALPEAKKLPFALERAAHEKALKQGYDEALLVDRSSRVPEAAYANIFWVKNNILSTSDKKMLPGITRAKVLKAAKKLRVSVQFALAKKSDLLSADEVFVTKSTTGITPIITINKTLIGSGKRGPLTARISAILPSI